MYQTFKTIALLFLKCCLNYFTLIFKVKGKNQSIKIALSTNKHQITYLSERERGSEDKCEHANARLHPVCALTSASISAISEP